MESMLSEFGYFNPTVLQSSIIKEYDESIAPVNSTGVQGNALSTFEFIIAGATDLYRDLNNSYVELKVKVVDAAGANLAATDAVAPANLFLHSLFANVSINPRGKEITERTRCIHAERISKPFRHTTRTCWKRVGSEKVGTRTNTIL